MGVKICGMRKLKYFFGGVFFVIMISGFYFITRQSKDDILGLSEEAKSTQSTFLTATSVPTPLIIYSPSPSATLEITLSTLVPVPTETPAPTPFYVSTSSGEINAFIDRFSAQYGIDPNVLRHIAICESGFNSGARNGTYIGLFQFGLITWRNIRREIGEDINPDLRFSAEESVQTAAYALSKGRVSIWPNCMP